MKKLPQKQSLVVQTATVLRDEIQSGAWPGGLPSERKLCEQLVVSRSTLCAALACLKHEGIIKVRPRSGWEVLRPKPVRSAAAHKSVIFFTPNPPHTLTSFDLFWIHSLREHLGEAGYRLEVCDERACYTARPEHVLEELVRNIRPAACILRCSSAPMQRWFSQRALPCVIVGARHTGVTLPTVDRDLPAACRHAAGRLIAKGHTRIAMLIHRNKNAGGPHCAKNFLDAAARFGTGDGQAVIAYYDHTREDLSRRLDELLRQQPAVTGFMVTHAHYALAALSILLGKGLRLPQDAALISRDDGSFLEYVVPSVAHYSVNPALFARKVSRTMLRLVQGEMPQDVSVMPRFVPGETFG